MNRREFLAALALTLASRGALAKPREARPARLLQVGPKRSLRTPSEAAAMVKTGDIVEIDAGTYTGDVAIWDADNLIIRGVGGRPVLEAAGRAYGGKGIWVTKGDNIAIENVEFRHARVPDKNGAGIKAIGRDLTVRRCVFLENENGIHASDNKRSEIVIEYSEFAGNGHGDGYSHAIYVNRLARLTFRYNYVHGTRAGHHVKSKAFETYVLYNRLADEDDGSSSYCIDITRGHKAVVVGNLLQQGLLTENPAMVHFEPGKKHGPDATFDVVNNTAISTMPGVFVRNRSQVRARVLDNVLVGPLQAVKGPADERGTVVAAESDFVAAARWDYRPKARLPASGSDKGALLPTKEYVHPAGARQRPDFVDAGAFARYTGGSGN